MKFPDVERMVLDFLDARVDAEVSSIVPKPRPDRFVRAWRNGGPSKNRIVDRPLITVEAWSLDSVDAAELAESARSALLHESAAMPLVRRVTEISGLYSTPDPESETPRYRFTMQLTVRATA